MRPSPPRCLVAIDPGVAQTGVVVFAFGRVVRSTTIRTRADNPIPTLPRVLERAKQTARALAEILREYDPEVVVIETYRDIPGDLRRASNRWSTPAFIGAVWSLLPEWQDRMVWSDPETVGVRYGGLKAAWSARRFGAVPGDRLITNEHERSAAAHGLAYLDAAAHGRRAG